jgi:serine/threonine protein kinase
MSHPSEIGNYTLIRELGTGSWGCVWLAEHRVAHVPVAIKIIDRRLLDTKKLQIRFVRELALIRKMDHPFIVKLFEEITTPDFTYLVQELAGCDSLFDYIVAHGHLSESDARRYFIQLISALEYLHDEQLVVHRDLKAENVLLDHNLNIRLGDFGLSQVFTQTEPHLSSVCGSPAYVSPEMITGHPYTKSVDVWSVGVLLYAMVTGKLPFDDSSLQGVLQKVAYTEPNYPLFMSPQLIDLLKKILVKNPNRRLTLDGIKCHPWVLMSP